MSNQSWLRLLVIILSIQISVALASEPTDTIDPTGRPERFHQGKGIMCALWCDDDVWELRMTGNKNEKVIFTGTVKVDGDRLNGEFGSLEKSNKPSNADWIFPHKDHKGFDFQFALFGRVDAVKFKVGPKAKGISFKILSGGDDDPRHILIGKQGVHPKKAEFTLSLEQKKK